MPRIPEKNDRYRTKARLCGDLAGVMLNNDLHYGTKFVVLSDATWVWSEFTGKYVGCGYWSTAALEILKDRKKLPEEDRKKLTHDHAVPKNIIIQRLMELSAPTPDAVNQVLESLCKGVVITRVEDSILTSRGLRSKMPENWNGVDPWARYAAVGIKLHLSCPGLASS